MTLREALETVRQVGSIRAENGKVKARFPEAECGRLLPALDYLRDHRKEALDLLIAIEADRGISLEEWRMRDITRQCDQYLRSLPAPPVLTPKPAMRKRKKPSETTNQIEFTSQENVCSPS